MSNIRWDSRLNFYINQTPLKQRLLSPGTGTGTEPTGLTGHEQPPHHRKKQAERTRSKSSSVAGCFSAPTCEFLPLARRSTRKAVFFSGGSGPARGDGGIGQFRWPCACVGENQNASRERERGSLI